jgi:hypothetical protein
MASNQTSGNSTKHLHSGPYPCRRKEPPGLPRHQKPLYPERSVVPASTTSDPPVVWHRPRLEPSAHRRASPTTAEAPGTGTLAPFPVSFRRRNARAHSSAVEHSPYKRGVTGSKPVAPTISEQQ